MGLLRSWLLGFRVFSSRGGSDPCVNMGAREGWVSRPGGNLGFTV